MFLWKLIKPLIFRMDPEKAHYFSMRLFSLVLSLPLVSWIFRRSFQCEDEALNKVVDGLHYRNPVGLAAGFDKDGRWLPLLQELGFGFIEVGTVTPRPQDGNPKPRLFRLVRDQSVINRMGFNNEGVDALVRRLEAFQSQKRIIIGGNIGKNKDTPNEQAAEDYLYCFKALFDHVDYFTINVSSPNTAGLRALQEKEPLIRLLQTIQTENHSRSHPKPVYLKIAPDLDPEALADVLDAVHMTRIQGLILTNTTIRRPSDLMETELASETGGLSGKAVRPYSDEILGWARQADPNITLMGAGGIALPEHAIRKLKLGADLVQVYTGMIFEGPWMIRKIKEGILNLHSKS